MFLDLWLRNRWSAVGFWVHLVSTEGSSILGSSTLPPGHRRHDGPWCRECLIPSWSSMRSPESFLNYLIPVNVVNWSWNCWRGWLRQSSKSSHLHGHCWVLAGHRLDRLDGLDGLDPIFLRPSWTATVSESGRWPQFAYNPIIYSGQFCYQSLPIGAFRGFRNHPCQ